MAAFRYFNREPDLESRTAQKPRTGSPHWLAQVRGKNFWNTFLILAFSFAVSL